MQLPTRDDIKALVQHRDLTVSLYLPTHEAGPATRENPIRFKNQLREARAHLEQSDTTESDIEALLRPAQQLANDNAFWQHQRQGLAMLLSAGESYIYPIPYPPEALTTVSQRFHLKPLLPILVDDGRFYILAVTLDRARLFETTRYSLREVPLEDTPTSLAEALRYDDTLEPSIRSHSVAGPRGGRAGSLPAQSVIEPDRKEEIGRFFAALDNGLRRHLEPQGARLPLIFAGNGAHFPIYQEANRYGGLFETFVEGNPDAMSEEMLHTRAWELAENHFAQPRERDIETFHQRAGSDPERVANTLEDILPASQDGRVEVLFVPLNDYRWGTYDPITRRVSFEEDASSEKLDLFDLAAQQTLENGGTVYVLDSSKIPGDSELAASYRF